MTSTSTPTAPASRAGSVDTPTVAGSVLPPETKEKDASDAEKGTLGEHKEIDPSTGEEEEGDRFIGGIKLALLMVGLLCSVFLVALDNTIVSTALPKIVSDFNALAQVVWIVTAYFLTQAGLMLTGGQLLTVTTTKIMFLVSIFIFEIGSLICGVAPTMNALIAGRAIAGVGGATIFVTVLSIMSELLRLKDRPLFFGLLGACWAVSSVVGPLVGGAFTDHVSWRWCFYINLPFGGLALATVIFFMPNRKARARPGTEHMTALDRWKKIDFVGSVLGLGLVTALLLALQWGGQTKPWSDGSVIACFVVFGVLVLIFLAWERYLGDDAMVPLYLLKNRTQVGATLESFMLFLALLIGIYYLPLWYQAKGHSAVRSGIDVLPFQLGTVASVMICGAIINTTGRYWPFLCFPPLLISVASGLLYTIDVNTPNARVIGYQILLGVGAGAALQNGILAIQAEYADREHMVPQTTAIVSWGQLIGGIIGIAIAGTIFASGLGKYLPLDLPENIRHEVRSSVSVVFTLPEPQRSTVIAAYIKSIDRVFLLGIPAGVLASLSSFLIKNYNLKERSQLHATGASI